MLALKADRHVLTLAPVPEDRNFAFLIVDQDVKSAHIKPPPNTLHV
jgi:hypothetical protein